VLNLFISTTYVFAANDLVNNGAKLFYTRNFSLHVPISYVKQFSYPEWAEKCVRAREASCRAAA
jgi:hypothetical protein